MNLLNKHHRCSCIESISSHRSHCLNYNNFKSDKHFRTTAEKIKKPVSNCLLFCAMSRLSSSLSSQGFLKNRRCDTSTQLCYTKKTFIVIGPSETTSSISADRYGLRAVRGFFTNCYIIGTGLQAEPSNGKRIIGSDIQSR